MVSDNEVRLTFIADTDNFRKEIQATKAQADRVTQAWARQKRTVERQIQATIRLMRSVNRMASSWLRLFGQSLDPTYEAIIQTILVAAESAVAIHRALDAATGGLSLAFTASASVGALILSAAAIGAAEAGRQDAQRSLNDAQAVMDSVGDLVNSLEGVF